MSKPIAVISGDIHYDLSTLEVADRATRMAIGKANELNVPFIANGDTHNSKANLRGECVKALIETFKTAKIKPYINTGNHDLLNERGTAHSLEFLRPYATVIDKISYCEDLESWIIPYHSNADELREYLKAIPKGSRLIMHQGLNGSNMGHYIQDKSALNPEDLSDFRTILSHYHARQDIKCGTPREGAVGLATYIGSPYTTSFGEARDPEKGFAILMSDGTLEYEPTNLRKHLIIETNDVTALQRGMFDFCLTDKYIVWIKIKATKHELAQFNKQKLPNRSYRIELIATDNDSSTVIKSTNQHELLDNIIDNRQDIGTSAKARLKTAWKNLCE